MRSASVFARVVQTAAAPGNRTREKKTSRVTSAKRRPASFKVYQSARRLCEAADAQSGSCLDAHTASPQCASDTRTLSLRQYCLSDDRLMESCSVSVMAARPVGRHRGRMERTGNTLESDVEAGGARLQQSFSVPQFVCSVHFYVCIGGLVNVKSWK